ncbi:type IV inositol polyphosphate 5-phosphatase 6-like isoform X2 [Malania oleifera]|uniref:type IV inositol polyphosphate 5-phosphatase 6-like isoform X2 n=1 Tax=Malania oleifera TaxID=397392 RepID=UPI0025AE6345|nr:type IV inositol polyphosphate 5-phosphatase 6-like isoform X2 [Malania oleifera]
MDTGNQKRRTRSWRSWFKQKHKSREGSSHFTDFSDEGYGSSDDGLVTSIGMESCISTNELRVFVGSWNVAGRSPVGSLAVDLDDWLNLKDAADIYVLGFQEIVPLKIRTIIGVEDSTPVTEWNTLIGKTLNNKYGCPWLTPRLNTIPSQSYYYAKGIPDPQRRFSVSSETPFREWRKVEHGKRNDGWSKYKLMASKKMVGVFISVWMKKELTKKYRISNVKVCSVACGIMGYLGNKGSVSVSMSIEGTSFCFIAAHLASGEKKGDERRRNYQVLETFRRTTFSRQRSRPLTMLGHDRIFWFGDLNYRLYLEDSLARQLVKKQDWRALQEFDQLRRELEDGGVFQGWKEGNIEFAPTYKYSSSNFNRYSGGLPSRSGEKQRTPAWCDRILWYGKGVEQLSYFRSESRFSDHRPVSALFSTQIEIMDPNRQTAALHTIHPTITPPNQTELLNGIVWLIA